MTVLLVVMAASQVWYNTGPLKRSRWRDEHAIRVAKIQAALCEEPDSSLIWSGSIALPDGMGEDYDEGLRLAKTHATAEIELRKQSAETVKVLSVTVTALKANNHIGLDALRNRIKEVLAKQTVRRETFSAVDKEWQAWKAGLEEAWQRQWPGNELDFEMSGSRHLELPDDELLVATQTYLDLAEIEEKALADSEELIDKAIAAADSKQELTPYEEDKLMAVKARIQFCELVKAALDDAYDALGGSQPDAAGEKADAPEEQVQGAINHASKDTADNS